MDIIIVYYIIKLFILLWFIKKTNILLQ